MDLKTLEALGIDAQELRLRVVDQAVETLLTSTGFDPDSETEETYETQFSKQIKKNIQATVDAKIAEIADVHILPRVGELIESANMRLTNRFGEAQGDPVTFREYIAARAEAYMSEPVDIGGKSKEEDGSYNWRAVGPRLTVLMKMYIRTTLESAAKRALTDVNKSIAEGMAKAALVEFELKRARPPEGFPLLPRFGQPYRRFHWHRIRADDGFLMWAMNWRMDSAPSDYLQVVKASPVTRDARLWRHETAVKLMKARRDGWRAVNEWGVKR